MAPKGGKGGGGGGGKSGGGISASCPGAFKMSYLSTPIPFFVSYCVFFLVILFIMIGIGKVKKNYPQSRKLLGGVYGVAQLCFLIGYALIIIATMLKECATTDYSSYFSWQIAFGIFFRLGYFILLVVFFWGVNSHLAVPLGGTPTYYKIISGVVLGFIGILTVAVTGLSAYNSWTATDAGSNAESVISPFKGLLVAYLVFFLLSIFAGFALMVVSISQMRSKGIPTHGLMGWAGFATFCMFIWVLFYLVEAIAAVMDKYFDQGKAWDQQRTYQAFEYIEDLFQALSFIAILCIAKHRAFANPAAAVPQPMYNAAPTYQSVPQQPEYQKEAVAQQQHVYQHQQMPNAQNQQYQYLNPATGQPYYYQQQQQQQPVYSNAVPMSAPSPEVTNSK
ncbi:uncharacterized protein BDR25DRAFT_308617 [Lindgomyces ingoldianus]|uniref:Uncharacterized protein n=1 Tax=Lindgomyces ingoldianus TaxID=673940 RepID=A0ACB6RGZ1_9PLEO|nr:uncharacterized protein BDR25DRAFT_308617 [Lindgomyces ingoldianus]KAF2477741.1 hypothetical protein BDR25DRAFT_308617 [Lindgomyces ingoldianus]